MTTTVVLARHGRTPWHHPNRYTGRSDVPLDDVGRAQAKALGEWAAGQGFTSLACSGLGRAVDTAAAVAVATGLRPSVDARLREVDFGIAEGHTLDDIRAITPAVADRFVADPVDGHFPDGEHPARAVDRFRAGIADLVAADRGGRVLVVAHSTIIRLFVCAGLSVPLRDYRRVLPALAPTATTGVRLPDDPAAPMALLAYNVPVSAGWAP